MDKISLIVPCYNEEECLPFFYEEVNKVTKKMDACFEFIFVNDGSKDKTLQIIKDLRKQDERVKYVSFSRNFGKEAGILAGLEYAKGDYVAMMDADLQDPPSLLPEMYEALKKEDYDCVATRSVSRHGYSFLRKIFTKWYYKIINKLSKTTIEPGARDFRLMSRKMVNAILELKEYNRFSKGIFSWVGFNTKWITFENEKRVAGKTKWNFWKLFGYSLESIVGFSTVPLTISVIAGFLFCLISFIMVIFIIVKTLVFGDPVAGWPSLVCIIFFVSGIQLFCTGILGEYLAKTYLEVKQRPIYIVKETDEENEK